jgi:outer membrane protein assembly factor BamE (lipoprotein component of BamABCDE complex)
MFSRAAAAVLSSAVLSSAILVSACTPITAYQGFQAVEANPKDVKVGVDSKSTVTERLGSPSAVAAFDTNTWFYISQISDQMAFRKANVRRRDIVAIAFDKADEKVLAVNSYTLKDGHVVPFNKRATPTRGRELSAIEQILGNIGQGQLLPQEDINPGSQRPR